MPAGQPTLYKPEYCEKIVQFMSEGKSLTAFAASINVTRETVYEWGRVHPEFSDAIQNAKEKCESYFENLGMEGMANNKDFKPAMWIFWMKARFGWREQDSDSEKQPVNVTINMATDADKPDDPAE